MTLEYFQQSNKTEFNKAIYVSGDDGYSKLNIENLEPFTKEELEILKSHFPLDTKSMPISDWFKSDNLSASRISYRQSYKELLHNIKRPLELDIDEKECRININGEHPWMEPGSGFTQNPPHQTHIYKCRDEWFWIWEPRFSESDTTYFKCDQFDGLIQFLKDKKLIR